MIKAALRFFLTTFVILGFLCALAGCNNLGGTEGIKSNNEGALEDGYASVDPKGEDEPKTTDTEADNNADSGEGSSQTDSNEENADPQEDITDDDLAAHQKDSEMLFMVAVYKSLDHIYLFSVSRDGTLETKLGKFADWTVIYYPEDFDDYSRFMPFMIDEDDTEEHYVQQLSQSQYKYVLEMAQKTAATIAYQKIAPSTNWNIHFIYMGLYDWGAYHCEEGFPYFQNLADTLLLLSPVTKLHDGESDHESLWMSTIEYYENHGWEVGRIPPDAEYPHDY